MYSLILQGQILQGHAVREPHRHTLKLLEPIAIVYIIMLLLYRDAYFTTSAANKGRQEWLDCIQKSIRKYNLYCQATESQIQEYLMGKYELFLNSADPDECPVKIAAQSVGLQYILEDDTTAEEIGIGRDTQIWVLNETTQVCIIVHASHLILYTCRQDLQ